MALKTLFNKTEKVVHAVCRRVVRWQQFAEEAVAFVRNKAGQRLGLDDGGHDHLMQLLLQHLHPGVVDVELQDSQDRA